MLFVDICFYLVYKECMETMDMKMDNMAYDLEYYYARDLTSPNKPAKPRLPLDADSVQALNYAKNLVTYESLMLDYDKLMAEYIAMKKQRMDELRNRLRDDYNLTQAQFDLLWHKAWEDGHSGGIHEVIYYFDELYDVATKFTKLER